MDGWWVRCGVGIAPLLLLLLAAWIPPTCGDMDKVRAKNSDNLHKTLGLETLPTFRLPLHVNLIFIGFDSKLQHSASVSTETLKRLLEAREGDDSFAFKHSYFLDSEFLSRGHRPEQGHVVDDIVIDIQTQVVELAPLTHMAVEAALKTFVRLEDKQSDGTSYQLDADKMGSLLESLLHATNLSDYYTLFVINPDRSAVLPDKKYGYRTGFSASEIDQLFKEQLTDRPVIGPLREDEITDDFPQDHDPDHEAEAITQTSARKFQSINRREIRDASEKWASSFLIQNRDVISAREKALKSGIPAEQCGQSETVVLKDANDLAEQDHDGHSHGSGHRINVQYNVSAVQVARHIRQSGSDSEKQYLDLVLNKGSEVVQENCMADIWQSRGRYAWIDFGAGPFSRTSPDRSDPGVNSEERLARPDAHLRGTRARADIVTYWTNFCRTRGEGWLSAAEKDLCQSIHALKVDPLLGKVAVDARHGHDAEKGADDTMNVFLKHLKVTVQTALRHLLVRPVAVHDRFNHGRIYSKEPKIRFHFYITADHNSFRPTDISQGGIDLMAFRHEMKKFALPSHDFKFHIVHLEKTDVESLWQAVHASVIDVKEFHGSQYGRVNSSNLALAVAKWMKLKGVEHGPDVFEVPIFLFSVARSIPLMFKGASQTATTRGAIVAFQSHHYSFPTGHSCNGRPIVRSLRNPLKAVLAAAAMYLTGLLPDHYSSPQLEEEFIRVDHLWSVGDSPLSVTSEKAHFTALHRDMAHRQTVILIAQYTLDVLFGTLDSLTEVQEMMSLELVAKDPAWRTATQMYTKTIQKVRKGLAQVSNLDLSGAVKTMGAALHLSSKFRDLVHRIASPQGVLNTAKKGAPHLPGWFAPFVIFASLCILAFVAFLWWKMTKPSYKYKLPSYKNR